MLPFTLHQLRILKTVAIEKSFTKAASNLYISQPSLSKQILLLEKNLGIRLINRQTNQITLTKKGKVFLKYSERILALCEESCRVIINRENAKQVKLKVGTNTSFGNYVLPNFLGLCNRSEPQFHLKIVVNSTEIIAKQILTNKLDIVLASEEMYAFLNKNTTIKIEYCMTDPLHLILSNAHPFAKQVSVSKKDLYDLNYITLESNKIKTDSINKLLLRNQIDIYQFKTVLQLGSLESVKTSVELGLGVAFIPALAIGKDLESETIKIIKVHRTKMDQKLFIISNLKRLDSRACKIFYSNLLQWKRTLSNKR